jgi:hypothetical protein
MNGRKLQGEVRNLLRKKAELEQQLLAKRLRNSLDLSHPGKSAFEAVIVAGPELQPT